MALGTRVSKIHSVSHFAMILDLGCLGLKSQIIANILKNFIKYFVTYCVFRPGEDISRGLLRDCETFANLCLKLYCAALHSGK